MKTILTVEDPETDPSENKECYLLSEEGTADRLLHNIKNNFEHDQNYILRVNEITDEEWDQVLKYSAEMA